MSAVGWQAGGLTLPTAPAVAPPVPAPPRTVLPLACPVARTCHCAKGAKPAWHNCLHVCNGEVQTSAGRCGKAPPCALPSPVAQAEALPCRRTMLAARCCCKLRLSFLVGCYSTNSPKPNACWRCGMMLVLARTAFGLFSCGKPWPCRLRLPLGSAGAVLPVLALLFCACRAEACLPWKQWLSTTSRC